MLLFLLILAYILFGWSGVAYSFGAAVVLSLVARK